MAFPHGEGCGQALGPDTDQLRRTLEGVLDHPNVSAALILGLGCEVNQISHYLGHANGNAVRAPAALQGLTLQESGGTLGAVEAARKQVKNFIDRAASEKRSEVPASKIVLGLNCGGSDSFSGITANPALGFCCDLIVEQGGTVVLAETTEIFGAEHLLVRRARNREIARKLLDCIESYKAYLRQFGGSFNDNPSPGNKEGGLTNIVEKSLGAVAKAGTSTLEDVVDYAERITTPGFRVHEHAGLRSSLHHGIGCRRRKPDRVYDRAGKRHRISQHSRSEDCKQLEHLSADDGQHGHQCRQDCGWVGNGRRSRARDLRHAPARCFRRKRRTRRS